jgi:hypothetical protein
MSRASRCGGHYLAVVIGMSGTSPAVTSEMFEQNNVLLHRLDGVGR